MRTSEHQAATFKAEAKENAAKLDNIMKAKASLEATVTMLKVSGRELEQRQIGVYVATSQHVGSKQSVIFLFLRFVCLLVTGRASRGAKQFQSRFRRGTCGGKGDAVWWGKKNPFN